MQIFVTPDCNDEKFLSDGGDSGSKKCTQGRVLRSLPLLEI